MSFKHCIDCQARPILGLEDRLPVHDTCKIANKCLRPPLKTKAIENDIGDITNMGLEDIKPQIREDNKLT